LTPQAELKPIVLGILLVTAIAGAGWIIGVRPMADRLAEAESLIDMQQQEISKGQTVVGGAGIDPVLLITQLTEHADTYLELWDSASDSSSIYDTLGAFASQSGVTIDRIEPTRGGDSRKPIGDKDSKASISSLGYSIELEGEFDQLTEFIAMIQTRIGMSRVDSINLMSTERSLPISPKLRANIQTTHINVHDALTGFKKDESAASDAAGGPDA